MAEFSCNLHPQKKADLQCEKCGLLLCSECRKENAIYHGPTRLIIPMSEILCPLCYKQSLLNNIKRNKIALWFIGILMAVLVIMSVLTDRLGLFVLVFFFMSLILILIGKAIGSFQSDLDSTERELSQIPGEIRKIVENTHKSILSPETPQKAESANNRESIYCQQCGSMMDIQAEFCPNCGESTEDEHSLLADH